MAEGLFSGILIRLAIFGTTLVPIDIREESTCHTLDLDAVTCYLGIGSYREWDEETRIIFLFAELMSKIPLFHTQNIDSNVMGFPMEYFEGKGER